MVGKGPKTKDEVKTVIKKEIKQGSSSSGSSKGRAAFTRASGSDGKLRAKAEFKEKKAAMHASGAIPENWPDECVVDGWCSWLPADWTSALKMTEGGLLLRCYIGPMPDRKRYFHKAALEAYLGRALTLEERGRKPIEFGEIDPKSFIQREPHSSVAYIRERCNQAHGKTVEEVLNSLTFDRGDGKGVQKYALSDLKYDVEFKRLSLVSSRPGGMVVVPPATPARVRPVPSTPGLAPVPSTPMAARIPSTPSVVRMPATPSACSPTTPSMASAPATPARPQRRAAAEPSTPAKQARTASSSRCAPAPSCDALKVFKACYSSVRTKASSSVEDEKSVYAMVGIGASLGLDMTMLKNLPALMAKPPAERGAFGEFVITQLEKQIAKRAC